MGFLVIAQTSTGASRNKIRRYLKYYGYPTIESHYVITNLYINTGWKKITNPGWKGHINI